MKVIRILSVIILFVGLSVPVAGPLLLTGCGTPAAKTTQVAGSVTITVDSAMEAWGSWVRTGKATVDQRIAVRGAYLKYQAAMRTAETIAVSALSAPDNQSAYVTALNVASQASIELIALVEAFSK